MSNFNSSKPAQLIDGDGKFNDGVGRELNFDNDRGLVGVVSIMGVQSSGKSTLMNKCFSTKFQEMNEEEGQTQTTKGISISKVSFSDAGNSHKILLLDCEGSDGAERNKEGCEVFEKQVTLFALASSDVVLINMKCDNVNLNNGAGMPLILNVFEVMVRKFNTPRRVTLLFVLRDKNRVPLEKLEKQLRNQLGETWNKVIKELTTPLKLDDFFKVEVVSLPHYVHKEEEFMREVAELRKRIFEVVKKGKLSEAANFISFTQKNWVDIQEDKVLNLQMNKNSADEEFFMKIKEEMIRKFSQNKDWIKMKDSVRRNVATKPQYSEFVTSLIYDYISEFDAETKSFDKMSKDDCRAQLATRFLEIIEDTTFWYVENIKKAALKSFKEDIATKIKTGNKIDIDQGPFLFEFSRTIYDDRIIQSATQTIPNYEISQTKSLQFEMDQHIRKLEELDRLRKKFKSKGIKVILAGGGFVMAAITSICLIATGVGAGAGAALLAASAPLAVTVFNKGLSLFKKKAEMDEKEELMAAGGVVASSVTSGVEATDVAADADGIHRTEGTQEQESNISVKLSTSGSKRSPLLAMIPNLWKRA